MQPGRLAFSRADMDHSTNKPSGRGKSSLFLAVVTDKKNVGRVLLFGNFATMMRLEFLGAKTVFAGEGFGNRPDVAARYRAHEECFWQAKNHEVP